jgi:hypothetical protein
MRPQLPPVRLTFREWVRELNPGTTTIRWSVWRAAMEFHVTKNKVRAGVVRHGIQPGPDGHYSTPEIFAAMAPDPLERKANEARWRGIIADAAVKQQKLKEMREGLLDAGMVRRCFALWTKILIDKIRHLPLPEREKQQMIVELKEKAKWEH